VIGPFVWQAVRQAWPLMAAAGLGLLALLTVAVWWIG